MEFGVEALLDRGRQARALRTGLPLDWLVALFYTVMHGAAAEITARRLAAADAACVITVTLLAACAITAHPRGRPLLATPAQPGSALPPGRQPAIDPNTK